MSKKNGYSTLRTGSRIVKLVAPNGGVPTHRLTGTVVSRSKNGNDLLVRFDDQTRTVELRGAKQQMAKGLIRRQAKR